MRAVAYVWSYNESDIIGHVVEHLLSQDVHVHLFDHWSTDHTAKIAREAAALCRVPIDVERWPSEQPVTASWRAMLQHTASVAKQQAELHGAHWCIHHDSDEFRFAPNDETIHDFLYRQRLVGWNAIDHHVQVFAPRDGYDPNAHHPVTYFTEPLADHFDQRNGQIKCWWQTPDLLVDLAGTGGHRVSFPGRKVCPEKLLLKHYPMRGEQQRAAKASSRNARWDVKEREMGWHEQYVR